MKKRLMLFLVFALCLFMPFTTQAKTKKVTKTLTVWVGKKKTVKIPKKKKQKIKCKVSNKKILTIKRKKNKVTIKAKKKGNAKVTVTSIAGKKKTVYVYKIKAKKKIPARSLEVINIPDYMEVGDMATVKPIIGPKKATNKNVSWKSSDSSIVSVNAAGQLVAKKKGTATITATSKSNKKLNVTFKVRVYPKEEFVVEDDDIDDDTDDKIEVTGIEISEIKRTIEIGQKFTYQVSLLPEDVTDDTVCFESEDPSIATVDSYGTVTGKGVGDTTIIIYPKSRPKMKKRIQLRVTDVMVKKLHLECDKSVITPGERVKLKITFVPENAANKELLFSSEDPRIATVTASGEIAGVSEGTTVITVSTATGSNVVARIPITVQKESEPIVLVEQIMYSEPEALTVGESFDLNATVFPADSSSQKIIYSTSDANVVSVSDDGVLTAKKAGNADITMQAGNNIKETFTVTVEEKEEPVEEEPTEEKEISILPQAMHMLLGENGKITIQNFKSTYGLQLKSSNVSVLSAKSIKNNDGVLTFTPVSPGMVNLTITVVNGEESKTFTCPITVTAPTENNSYLHLDANEKETNLGKTVTVSLINGEKYSGTTEFEIEDDEMLEEVSKTSSSITLKPLMSGVSYINVKRGGFTLPCKIKATREKEVKVNIPYDMTTPVKAGETHTYTIENLTDVDTYNVSMTTDYKVKNISPEITEYTEEDKKAEIAKLTDHKDGTFTLEALHQGTAEITIRCPNARLTQKIIVPIIN